MKKRWKEIKQFRDASETGGWEKQKEKREKEDNNEETDLCFRKISHMLVIDPAKILIVEINFAESRGCSWSTDGKALMCANCCLNSGTVYSD